jgi:hypothetical protein
MDMDMDTTVTYTNSLADLKKIRALKALKLYELKISFLPFSDSGVLLLRH